jgi:CBS domain-containing protein
MHTDVSVGDLMTRDPICVSPDITILDCAKVMVKKKVGSLIVSQNSVVMGIVTHEDILWALLKKSRKELADVKISVIAKRKVYTLHPEDSIESALQKMYKLKFRRMPVVDAVGKLVGMLTIKDVLLLNPALYEDLHSIVDIRETTKKLYALKSFAKNRSALQESLCQQCGKNSVLLPVDGRMICPDCREAM